MQLKQIISETPYILKTYGNMDIEIEDLSEDSRLKKNNSLFFCISGEQFDAHKFAPQAIDNGNVAIVAQHYINNLNVPQIIVSDSRGSMARMAATFFNHPEKKLRMVGITGTKGKTTTTYMLKSICEAAGFKTGLIGTTGNLIANKHLDSKLTTPCPIDLFATLQMMVDENVQVVTMEVSAHAIDMKRLDGIEFEAACYTNLSQDHLDYFGTMEKYFESKKSFFITGGVKNAVINADEDTSADILKDLKIPYITYAIGASSDVYARDIEILESGASFNVHLSNIHDFDIKMNMTGNFNVYNALAAVSLAMVMNIDYQYIKEGLENVKSVPGRIEILPTVTPYKVILDYSHSPDALENILCTVREFTKGKVIVVFGCGGDRDHGKRPIMGEIAGKLADYSVITSDNPRTEDPMEIIKSIEEGIKSLDVPYKIIENRREAIKFAMENADEGDVIVLAGKGHETYQEINKVKYPFDEKVVVQQLLTEIGQ